MDLKLEKEIDAHFMQSHEVSINEVGTGKNTIFFCKLGRAETGKTQIFSIYFSFHFLDLWERLYYVLKCIVFLSYVSMFHIW